MPSVVFITYLLLDVRFFKEPLWYCHPKTELLASHQDLDMLDAVLWKVKTEIIYVQIILTSLCNTLEVVREGPVDIMEIYLGYNTTSLPTLLLKCSSSTATFELKWCVGNKK